MRLSLISLLVVLLSWTELLSLNSIQQPKDSAEFFFEVVSFRGKSSKQERVDVYIAVPYRSLLFVRNRQQQFTARYELELSFYRQGGQKFDTLIIRTINTDSDDAAAGITADFDSLQIVWFLPAGRYRCRLELYDRNARRTYLRQHQFSVTDYHRFPFSLSSLMFLSAVERYDSIFVITPHLSSNITPLLPDDLFLYVEAYAQQLPAAVAYFVELLDRKQQQITRFPSESLQLRDTVTPIIRRLNLPEGLRSGTYYLSVTLHQPTSGMVKKEHILAVSLRSLTIEADILRYPYISAQELEEAIRQLRYVATAEEIRFILEGKSVEERRARFQNFWKRLDPTPNTERNEAFEEYYRRIAAANRLFSTYRPGWLTDRGKVYVIFGPPESREQFVDPQSGLYVERWYYAGNRVFEFVDFSGFGDYRLVTPLSPTVKYRYL